MSENNVENNQPQNGGIINEIGAYELNEENSNSLNIEQIQEINNNDNIINNPINFEENPFQLIMQDRGLSAFISFPISLSSIILALFIFILYIFPFISFNYEYIQFLWAILYK